MGSIASQEHPDSGTPSEEGGARAAILNAARRVAERDGVIEMTLTGVAKDAGVAATDIYTFFTSKNDLLQAVIADDLASLAKAMRRSLEHEPTNQPTNPGSAPGLASSVPLAVIAHEPQGAASEPVVQDTQTHDIETPSSEGAAPARAPEVARRFPVVRARREARTAARDAHANAATAEAVAQLQEAVAKLQAAPVDQWLERRLREFERTLYTLQHNQNHRASSNVSEQGLQALRESLEALDMRHTMATDESARATGERFDAFDKHLRETASELQAESVHLARRITALENLAFASRPEETPPPPVAPFAPVEEPEAIAKQQPLESTETPTDTTEDLPPDGGEDAPSYLTTARRSAQAAAAAQASETLRQKKPAPKSNRTMLYATCASLAVFVVLLAGLEYLMRNASMNAPVVHVVERSAPLHVVRMARAVVAKPLQPTAQKLPQANLLTLAESGDASAELLVGLEYLEGKGEPKNEAAAVDWLSRAAAKGQPVAQYDLGALYADGRGVKADSVQAFQWFGSAALRGNRRAMHFLAIAYAEGVGTAKDLPEAARWFERAAALGAVNSQFNLAVLYERGMGVPQSLTEAYKWYAIAAAQGDPEAKARVAALASTLTPADLANATNAAESFKPEPLDPVSNLAPKFPS